MENKSKKEKRLVVLVSGGGSNLQALIDAASPQQAAPQDGQAPIPARISKVIADTKGAFALERAVQAGIETALLDKRDKGRFPIKADFEKALLEEIQQACPDLVVLAGFLSILPAAVVAAYRNQIVNIHPSLIPKYAGMGFYGHKVHEAVLAAGEKESGATVHFVDEGVDTGRILLQEKVAVQEGDTPDTLAARVLEAEHRILPEAVRRLCAENEV